jgi:phenylalanine-4-hydroxylase
MYKLLPRAVRRQGLRNFAT